MSLFLFVLKNKKQIFEDFDRGCPRNRKVRRHSHYDLIDDKCAEWLLSQFWIKIQVNFP